ncbi:hypothetical protein Taro_045245 [Colocasia esculenta]|uniref:Uncharacterized protein n=1 Tax=Colocasia esculenta TaxID=4460 RepID=A0A843WWJ9_COLES|nr:hypothetical protein [Colocasia esculenta]
MTSPLLPLPAAVALLSAFLLAAASEFTVVTTSDSPALVDAPQTGFSARARTDPAEQAAVYEIMAATGNGWASSIPDVCRGRWHGIECMPDRDEVYHIVSLSFGALSDDTAFPACDRRRSTLSPALACLPHVRGLFFYQCFSGNPQPVPAFLGRLGATLRSLVLRQNGHVGAIPPELRNLTSLRVLDLHGNSLSSSIPPSLAALPRLHLLDLSRNQLTGEIPRFSLPSVSVLDLNDNLLHGQIPASLGSCASLIKLDLSKNRLSGTIPSSLGELRELILLDLGHNRLSGPLPASLGRLASLKALILGANHMGPAAFPDGAFEGMRALTTLVLSGTGLRGPIPESIGRITTLRVLYLDDNHLNGSVPASFRDLGSLSELRLDGNQLSGPLPFSRQVLWRMGRKLKVSNNPGICYNASAGERGNREASYLPGAGPCGAVSATATMSTTGTRAPAVASAATAAASRGSPGGH